MNTIKNWAAILAAGTLALGLAMAPMAAEAGSEFTMTFKNHDVDKCTKVSVLALYKGPGDKYFGPEPPAKTSQVYLGPGQKERIKVYKKCNCLYVKAWCRIDGNENVQALDTGSIGHCNKTVQAYKSQSGYLKLRLQ